MQTMTGFAHAPADPVVADPVVADPVVADPVVADPVVADPVVADPVVADMAGPRPADVHRSLSPSRASDFMCCPLLYRFRVIDKLPQTPSIDALRGTVVHAVLERLFDLPSAGRTPDEAIALLEPTWTALVADDPELATLFAAGRDDLDSWLASCRTLLERYFTLEDPARLEPAEREVYVETELASGLLLRGYIDRVDVASTGELRIVDYKTGRSPHPSFEAKALFQMKFYALVLWRTRGVVPRMLQLIYLGNAEVLRYEPEVRDLLATERKLEALWRAIARATETGDWRPSRSALCGWCDHRKICPAWGGTPPPLPDRAAAQETAASATAAGAGLMAPAAISSA